MGVSGFPDSDAEAYILSHLLDAVGGLMEPSDQSSAIRPAGQFPQQGCRGTSGKRRETLARLPDTHVHDTSPRVCRRPVLKTSGLVANPFSIVVVHRGCRYCPKGKGQPVENQDGQSTLCFG